MTTLHVEQINRDEHLTLLRLGFRKGQLNILLGSGIEPSPAYVLELHDMLSFWHNPTINAPVSISLEDGCGSFGWWLPSGFQCKQLRIAARSNVSQAILLALAKSVICRIANGPVDLNFPG
jgi:hypothetical protein